MNEQGAPYIFRPPALTTVRHSVAPPEGLGGSEGLGCKQGGSQVLGGRKGLGGG